MGGRQPPPPAAMRADLSGAERGIRARDKRSRKPRPNHLSRPARPARHRPRAAHNYWILSHTPFLLRPRALALGVDDGGGSERERFKLDRQEVRRLQRVFPTAINRSLPDI